MPFVQQVLDLPQPDCSMLKRSYRVSPLEYFSRRIIELMGLVQGYDCRLDVSAHPFCHGELSDIRMTTRFTAEEGLEALYSTFHEAGHGLYVHNLPGMHVGMPVASPVSLGVHESQSRFWEVLIGKSRAFLAYFFDSLQNAFPESLSGESAETLFRALNTAQATSIRINADPVTYNLHIFLRFELEEALLSGEVEVGALPEEWNRRFKDLFGFTPESDAQGALQDVHWAGGYIGYFPTYAIGNMLASQLYEAVRAAQPNLESSIAAGKFVAIRSWLREKVHQHGSFHDAKTLIKKATGKPLDCEAFMRFLKDRCQDVYQSAL